MGDAASVLAANARRRAARRIKQIDAHHAPLAQRRLPVVSGRKLAHPAQRTLRVRRDGVVVRGVLDQKAQLWRRYRRSRSRSLRARMVELYLPAVYRMAALLKPLAWGRVDMDDLRSAAVIGLLRAIETFDPDRATPFESYLGLLVRGAVVDEVRRQDWISREARDRVAGLTRARRKLFDRLGREPGDLEVAAYLHIPFAEVRERDQEANRAQLVSLEGLPDEASWLELAADRGLEPAEVAEQRETLAALEKHLTPIERVVVYFHYHEGRRLREVAALLGLSESRICQIHGQLISRLKQKLA
jgi:RNA polymerase sigma factor for flagellar operon FliA